MKKNRKNVPLGRRSTEVAGSLTPDLEDLHASRQHADRSYAGHSGEADGGRLHENRGDIVPHLGPPGRRALTQRQNGIRPAPAGICQGRARIQTLFY